MGPETLQACLDLIEGVGTASIDAKVLDLIITSGAGRFLRGIVETIGGKSGAASAGVSIFSKLRFLSRRGPAQSHQSRSRLPGSSA